MTEYDLDPEFAMGGEERDPGMNLRTQLYALSKDESECATGLIRYLGMKDMSEFSLQATCLKLQSHPKKPLKINLPVSLNPNQN